MNLTNVRLGRRMKKVPLWNHSILTWPSPKLEPHDLSISSSPFPAFLMTLGVRGGTPSESSHSMKRLTCPTGRPRTEHGAGVSGHALAMDSWSVPEFTMVSEHGQGSLHQREGDLEVMGCP